MTLDVEWAHAAAPGAKILLALARSNDDTDVYNTSKYVVHHNLGDVISQGFGEAETMYGPDPARRAARAVRRGAAEADHGVRLVGRHGASSRRTSFLMIGVSQSCRPRLRHSATVVIADPLAMSSKT